MVKTTTCKLYYPGSVLISAAKSPDLCLHGQSPGGPTENGRKAHPPKTKDQNRDTFVLISGGKTPRAQITHDNYESLRSPNSSPLAPFLSNTKNV